MHRVSKASWSSTGPHVTDAEHTPSKEIAGDVSYAQITTCVEHVAKTRSIAIIDSNLSIPNARHTKTLVVTFAWARIMVVCHVNASFIPMKIGVRGVKQEARRVLGDLK